MEGRERVGLYSVQVSHAASTGLALCRPNCSECSC